MNHGDAMTATNEHENAVKAIHSRTYELYRQTVGLSMRRPPEAGKGSRGEA